MKYEAFNQGAAPVVTVYNQAKTPLGFKLDELVAALNEYVSKLLAPVWGCPATLVTGAAPAAGTWSLVFLDDADAPGALAYHDLSDGLPIMKVFVKTTLDAGESVPVSASHELCEGLVDPAINLLAQGPRSDIYALECADPCEEATITVGAFALSDFAYPAYFETFRAPGSVRFDAAGRVTAPLQLLSGGYQMVMQGGTWSNVFGSADKAARFAKEDRRGHRSEYRKRVPAL